MRTQNRSTIWRRWSDTPVLVNDVERSADQLSQCRAEIFTASRGNGFRIRHMVISSSDLKNILAFCRGKVYAPVEEPLRFKRQPYIQSLAFQRSQGKPLKKFAFQSLQSVTENDFI